MHVFLVHTLISRTSLVFKLRNGHFDFGVVYYEANDVSDCHSSWPTNHLVHFYESWDKYSDYEMKTLVDHDGILKTQLLMSLPHIEVWWEN